MGFSFRRMFRNPFGKHSLFHKATQIASVLPIPGAGLIGKAFGLANRARNSYDRLKGAIGPVLGPASALVPALMRRGTMPGGLQVAAASATPTRARRAARGTRRPRRKTRKRRR